jgi:hypothetical protein
VEEFPYNFWLSLSGMTAMGWPYGPQVSPLYIFAVEDAPNLIKAEVKRVLSLDIRGGYYGNPLNAAVSMGNHRALRALLTMEHGEVPTACVAENEDSSTSTNDRAAATATCFDTNPYKAILELARLTSILEANPGGLHCH